MEYILIGKIVNTFGIKGELKVEVHTDFVEERYSEGSTFYIGDDHKEYTSKKYRTHKNYVLLTLKGHEDINLVEHLKNKKIYIKDDDLKPLNNAYYFKDLMDCDVYMDNELKGKVISVEEGKASSYIRVEKKDGKSNLVPVLDVYLEKVDINIKRIDLKHMEGLL